jgi:hypothetical protein
LLEDEMNLIADVAPAAGRRRYRRQIGIWQSAAHTEGNARHDRRLVSFAPGVVFREMGLLALASRVRSLTEKMWAARAVD